MNAFFSIFGGDFDSLLCPFIASCSLPLPKSRNVYSGEEALALLSLGHFYHHFRGSFVDMKRKTFRISGVCKKLAR